MTAGVLILVGALAPAGQAAAADAPVGLIAGVVAVTVALATAVSGIMWRSAFEAQKARSTALEERVVDLTASQAESDAACERKLLEVKHGNEVQVARMEGHVSALEGRLGDRLVDAIERAIRRE